MLVIVDVFLCPVEAYWELHLLLDYSLVSLKHLPFSLSSSSSFWAKGPTGLQVAPWHWHSLREALHVAPVLVALASGLPRWCSCRSSLHAGTVLIDYISLSLHQLLCHTNAYYHPALWATEFLGEFSHHGRRQLHLLPGQCSCCSSKRYPLGHCVFCNSLPTSLVAEPSCFALAHGYDLRGTCYRTEGWWYSLVHASRLQRFLGFLQNASRGQGLNCCLASYSVPTDLLICRYTKRSPQPLGSLWTPRLVGGQLLARPRPVTLSLLHFEPIWL